MLFIGRCWRKRRRLRLRAFADLSFAFCDGGMKCACFLRSLMISSLITFRLKRRSADSIDSFEFTVIYAIYRLTPFRLKIRSEEQTNI